MMRAEITKLADEFCDMRLEIRETRERLVRILTELRAEGLSLQDIGDVVGLTRQGVAYHLKAKKTR